MKSIEEFYSEIRKNAIDHWRKEGNAFTDIEDNLLANLLLSAFSYQSFRVQNNLEQQEERMLADFRDRTVPYQLIKPTPAFSIVETNLANDSDEAVSERIIDETCRFAFKKASFVPLLKTKVINAKSVNITGQDPNIRLELQLAAPIESLSGLSLFFNTSKAVSIENITCNNIELPIIKPSQYNELPFTKWFNNAHLRLNQNHYLFGTYDYWQEIFLTNTTPLFYIGEYNPKTIPLHGQTRIQLDITLSSSVDVSGGIKINCIPVVDVQKKEITLDNANPVQSLSIGNRAFLNLLYDKDAENFDDYMSSFSIKQHGVERYNLKQLLGQMQEILHRSESDFYAFRLVEELKNSSKITEMQEVINEIYKKAGKLETTDVNGDYYAIFKNNKNKNVHLSYLTTSGTAANGIKKDEKALITPDFLDRDSTALLLDTKGGKNSVNDEVQKENIAKYYFQTKDRLVTPADIRTFIRTFYYDESKCFGNEIENINIQRVGEYMSITIKLKNDSELKNSDKFPSLTEILQNKITLKSSGILPFQVEIL
jgi:hypothetical protein